MPRLDLSPFALDMNKQHPTQLAYINNKNAPIKEQAEKAATAKNKLPDKKFGEYDQTMEPS